MSTAIQPAGAGDVLGAVRAVRTTIHVLRLPAGHCAVSAHRPDDASLVATIPATWPEHLGGPDFTSAHGCRFPYIVGEMANGIATARMVVEAGRAGFLGFFGAAGLSLPSIEAGLDQIERDLGPTGLPWGINLIHSPNEPDHEAATVDLYLRRRVRRVSASAYMGLTPSIVRYAFSGARRDASGAIVRPNSVFAKVSRPEVAGRFLAPPPREMLQGLVSRGDLTEDEARLAAALPVAEDLTVEADSGGHTDNRPLVAMFPLLAALRDRAVAATGRPIRIGAAGGLGTPTSVAAAFQLGASYVMTGSVNQAAVESGLSEVGRQMLARAGIADVVMAPAADMFELGVKVQVLRRGTMFGVRAHLLYDAYVSHPSIQALPGPLRERLEREVFRRPLSEIVEETRAFWARRDPRENAKAATDPKHEMALAFRWYLGLSSRWAIAGDADRAMDYQIWAGPAQGAFNDWVAGSFLEAPEARTVAQIGRNLLEGAAQIVRCQQLRLAGVAVPPAAWQIAPRPLG